MWGISTGIWQRHPFPPTQTDMHSTVLDDKINQRKEKSTCRDLTEMYICAIIMFFALKVDV